MTTPIKNTPAVPDDYRPITSVEQKFFKTMADHYRERCLAEPCNRELKQHWKMYLDILSSGVVNTFSSGLLVSDEETVATLRSSTTNPLFSSLKNKMA